MERPLDEDDQEHPDHPRAQHRRPFYGKESGDPARRSHET